MAVIESYLFNSEKYSFSYVCKYSRIYVKFMEKANWIINKYIIIIRGSKSSSLEVREGATYKPGVEFVELREMQKM